MTTILHISISSVLLCHGFDKKPINSSFLSRVKLGSLWLNKYRLGAYREQQRWCLMGRIKDGILLKDEGRRRRKNKRMVLARFNQGFGFNGGGGSGGGGDNNNSARILGNLALAIGLTYLSMTGQLGWVLDAIVSIWLLLVIVPVVGLGAFIWWAGRDIIQSSCPNCGNDFQVFKSSLNDELQLCPFCSQPFSVVDDKFVKDSIKFSNKATTFGQAFSDFSPSSKKEKKYSTAVVDVEAEIKDAE